MTMTEITTGFNNIIFFASILVQFLKPKQLIVNNVSWGDGILLKKNTVDV
ncbi:hypothetical protein SDC9_137879 [bioreactor metagenome]|uniref:Uncharacterized protein n=1 Tax=bioreactor metagenome TaxID=1076179 RepID=A0A645DN92_9ZZZZ